MKLYHGSNVQVREPKILESVRTLDFGTGFYLTSDYEQAKKWAILKQKRNNSGAALISVFEIDENVFKELSTLKFNEPNIEWLNFVCNNRKNIKIENNYDFIIGPVANDNTMPVINWYLQGRYDEQDALKRLMPQKLKNQYVCKTEKAISKLKYKEVIGVDE